MLVAVLGHRVKRRRLLLAAALAALPAWADETRFTGVVTCVSDGDTVWVQPDPGADGAHRQPIRLRLVGLDAPERCQAHGPEARAALIARVLRERVTVRRRATDQHGRALGTLWLGSQDLGAWLVREGHAWSARYHGNAGPYADEERQARVARRGVFAAPQPMLPRDFRRQHGPCEPPRAGSR